MRIGLITLGALSAMVSLSAYSQNRTGATQPSPPTAPAMPRTLQREQVVPPGLRPSPALPSQVQNPVQPPPGAPVATNVVPNRGALTNQPGGVVRNQAKTATDRALLVRIQQTVQRQFRAASPWTPVHFNVDNGVVTLVGTVPNEGTEEQLEALVQQIPGVTGVVDQLMVGSTAAPQTATVADQRLLLRIRQTVLPQVRVANMPVPIDFNVQQGVVTILGTLPNLAQRREVAALVRQVPGVVQVNNQVAIGRAVGTRQPSLPVAGSAATRGILPNNGLGTSGSQPVAPGVNSNLTPTGRTNPVTLPPGVQNPNQLPSALLNQTNTVPRLSR